MILFVYFFLKIPSNVTYTNYKGIIFRDSVHENCYFLLAEVRTKQKMVSHTRLGGPMRIGCSRVLQVGMPMLLLSVSLTCYLGVHSM